MFSISVGMFLRHSRHPEWGIGIVTGFDEIRIHIDFELGLGKTLILEFAGPSLEVVELSSTTRDALGRIDAARDIAARPRASTIDRCRQCDQRLNRSRYNSQRTWKSCPHCSVQDGSRHIFYPFPGAFGTTPARSSDETPDGAQSYCTACRQGVHPHFDRRFCGEI